MKHIITYFILFCTVSVSFTQVGINNPNPDTTAILDLTSNKLGLLVPRMTSFERRAIVNPANALFVYDTDDAMFYFNDSTYTAGTNSWTGLSAFRFRDNLGHFDVGSGLYKRDIYTHLSTRYVGIGTQTPLNQLSINGNVSIGDSTTTASENGLYVKGEAKFDDDLNVTQNITADSVKATVIEGFGVVPVGGIIMWQGSTPPSGWVICEGSIISDVDSPINGSTTPDLKGRFIVGAGTNGTTDYTINTSGGTTTHEHVVDDHTHSIEHNHAAFDVSLPGSAWTDGDKAGVGALGTFEASQNDEFLQHNADATLSADPPNHTSSSGGSTPGTSTINHVPPYYTLAYIMRIK